MLKAIQCVHEHLIVHGDIKPENFVVASKKPLEDGYSLKIVDFGLASIFQPGNSGKSIRRGGSPFFMAPELVQAIVLEDKKGLAQVVDLSNCPTDLAFTLSPKLDIWAFSITIIYLFLHVFPFPEVYSCQDLFPLILGHNNLLAKLPSTISPEFRDFLNLGLAFHPVDRPSAAELLQHPFLKGVENMAPW
jgi:serine/threonine protein kinase